ncbi:MAG: helix-turn-helix domain-containing protein [Myxococcaceae bacterium]
MSSTRVELPKDGLINGEVLRRIREQQGISLQHISDRTRISRTHLENIEADRFDALPAMVYLRGFLVSLAKELGVDSQATARGYLNTVATRAASKS